MGRSLGRPWFAARSYGFGSGLPIAWQGWAALAAFVIGVFLTVLRLGGWVRWAMLAWLTVAFVAICALKTDGGWRWRARRDS